MTRDEQIEKYKVFMASRPHPSDAERFDEFLAEIIGDGMVIGDTSPTATPTLVHFSPQPGVDVTLRIKEDLSLLPPIPRLAYRMRIAIAKAEKENDDFLRDVIAFELSILFDAEEDDWDVVDATALLIHDYILVGYPIRRHHLMAALHEMHGDHEYMILDELSSLVLCEKDEPLYPSSVQTFAMSLAEIPTERRWGICNRLSASRRDDIIAECKLIDVEVTQNK